MPYDIPTLNGLRAFEAAARLGAIKEAAIELHVTSGAVSQQVKSLEGELGAALFHRGSRGIVLTEAGAILYPVVRDAMQRISNAVEGLRDRERVGIVTVSVMPSFAAKWLVPRLGGFREAQPDIDVRISANPDKVDFSREDVDLAIRYGHGPFPGLRCDWLLGGDLFPVCAPGLLRGPHPLTSPEALRHHTLLHDETHEDWEVWLRTHRVDDVRARRGTVFTDAAMALQAAMQGQGVALGRAELVGTDLAEGRLVRPFALNLPNRNAYWVVCPESVADWPKVAAFREWVLQEAEAGRSAV